jgi:hypothetical protein
MYFRAWFASRKAHITTTIAFCDESAEALAPYLAEIAFDHDAHAVIGEFLQDFPRHSAFKVEKPYRQRFLLDYEPGKTFVPTGGHQVQHLICIGDAGLAGN